MQQHEDFYADFQITPFGEVLRDFSVEKDAIDVGCGTGLMGIVMAINGARNVQMSDFSEQAVENSIENVSKYNLSRKVRVIHGDMFVKIAKPVDCITFNQPYFPGNPPEDDTIAASMLAPPDAIRRFLRDARCYLNRGGVIVMPSFSLAGDLNNPYKAGIECGYRVDTKFVAECTTGLQKGRIAMHELRLA